MVGTRRLLVAGQRAGFQPQRARVLKAPHLLDAEQFQSSMQLEPRMQHQPGPKHRKDPGLSRYSLDALRTSLRLDDEPRTARRDNPYRADRAAPQQRNLGAEAVVKDDAKPASFLEFVQRKREEAKLQGQIDIISVGGMLRNPALINEWDQLKRAEKKASRLDPNSLMARMYDTVCAKLGRIDESRTAKIQRPLKATIRRRLRGERLSPRADRIEQGLKEISYLLHFISCIMYDIFAQIAAGRAARVAHGLNTRWKKKGRPQVVLLTPHRVKQTKEDSKNQRRQFGREPLMDLRGFLDTRDLDPWLEQVGHLVALPRDMDANKAPKPDLRRLYYANLPVERPEYRCYLRAAEFARASERCRVWLAWYKINNMLEPIEEKCNKLIGFMKQRSNKKG